MASEIRVDKINSLSGVGTVTLSPTGVDVAGGISTFHNDLKVSGIATVGSLSVDTGFIKIIDSIIHTGDSNTKIRFPDADTFTVETAGSERLRIESGGNIGIGTDNPNNLLHVYGGQIKAQTSTDDTNTNVDLIRAQCGSGGNALLAIRAADAADDNSDWDIKTNANENLTFSMGGTERVRIATDGDVTIADGDLIIGTAGHGIDFSAQTASSVSGATPGSEILDHYEEGSWTPVISFGGGTTGITYDARDGEYTRIGRQVTIHFMVDLSDKGSSTGYATVTGLPFAIPDLISDTVVEASGSSGYWNNFTPHMMWVGFSAETSTSNLSIRFQPETGASDAVGAMTDSNFADNTTFRGTVTYFTS